MLTKITAHAQQRKQQRGINDLKIQLINLFGTDSYQKGGSYICSISEKRIQEIRQALDQLAGIVLIKGNDDRLITVLHQTKKIRCAKYSA